LITTSSLQYTYKTGTDNDLTALVSFPGASSTPSGTVCHSGATSLGWCGFAVQAQITTDIVKDPDGGYARFQYWPATATSSSPAVCEGDSGGTVFKYYSSAGQSIYGVVSARFGADRNSVKGVSCSADLGFTYWGQGRSVFPNYLPKIVR